MTTVANPTYRQRIGYQAGLLGGFAMVAAAMLVMGDIATREAIDERQAEDLLASLGQVIPAGVHDNNLLADTLTLDTPDGTVTVYRALEGLDVTAVAFETVGQGYGGAIRVLLGVDKDGRILGARVLSHTETPGLGDHIEAARDDWILSFDGKSLGDPPPARWAVKKDGGVFDQFSGATITPRAVVKSVKEGLELFAAHRDALTASAVQQTATAQ
ncbi:MAG: electron transport complex subunit RsxG [Thiohalocapsa sp.]|jgi:electron transport complex protein RnfG|uniref:electron transport complex subunit RsxG n=1 Tax=Thiohalocapsa sp. TaxID=2497641 RepID=UPI0025E8CA14|nr:electron transport complex subunit RsxG [Thiohalocapsa sp.]MCG6943595.1 electron transport complex subunit RsxG [Thiohalocapsa sp.]